MSTSYNVLICKQSWFTAILISHLVFVCQLNNIIILLYYINSCLACQETNFCIKWFLICQIRLRLPVPGTYFLCILIGRCHHNTFNQLFICRYVYAGRCIPRPGCWVRSAIHDTNTMMRACHIVFKLIDFLIKLTILVMIDGVWLRARCHASVIRLYRHLRGCHQRC